MTQIPKNSKNRNEISLHTCIICPQYPPSQQEGGISHYTHLLVKQLLRAHLQVTVFTGDDHLGGASPEKVITFNRPWSQASALSMNQFLESSKRSLLNIQYSPAGYPREYLKALPNLLRSHQSVISLHTLWGGHRYNMLTGFLLCLRAKRIIATNSEILYLLKKRLPFFLKKTRFIPIGANIAKAPLDPHKYTALTKRYSLNNDIPAFIFFGMIYGGKGLETLLGAAEILHTERNLDFRLLLVGGGVSDTSKHKTLLQKQIAHHSCAQKIIVTGKLPAVEVSYLFHRCCAAVFPYESGVSDRRGSLMAGLNHHKAIVTSQPCVPINYFRNEQNMLWSSQYASRVIADNLYRVYTDTALRDRLEKGARQLADGFSWSRIGEDTVHVFKELA